MNQKFEGILRHILSLLGGLLIAIGVVQEDLVTELTELIMMAVGAIFTIIAFVRSWVSKKPDEEIIAEAVKIALAEYTVKQK